MSILQSHMHVPEKKIISDDCSVCDERWVKQPHSAPWVMNVFSKKGFQIGEKSMYPFSKYSKIALSVIKR